MKKICLIFISLIVVLNANGQVSDSAKVAAKPLTDIQRDSLLTNIGQNVRTIADETTGLKNKVGRYKVYRTTNIYNSLKLDTASGRITALQIGINNDKSRFEYTVCDAIEDDPKWRIIGRYELYPTGNNFNFILIDTILGQAYQVQWSTKNEECGIWVIW
ncbi:hypothetical protein [uncultured Alistipes sp.]|jgi:uncharacterized protein (DUF1684 family)|uniref:hypothetical protein n=1 Tax=uncultured Alistipes sp. TaxID=538949 RepID=UPI002599B8F7|nr:hypothetical protein [uncultured Alistipes sp.]